MWTENADIRSAAEFWSSEKSDEEGPKGWSAKKNPRRLTKQPAIFGEPAKAKKLLQDSGRLSERRKQRRPTNR